MQKIKYPQSQKVQKYHSSAVTKMQKEIKGPRLKENAQNSNISGHRKMPKYQWSTVNKSAKNQRSLITKFADKSNIYGHKKYQQIIDPLSEKNGKKFKVHSHREIPKNTMSAFAK